MHLFYRLILSIVYCGIFVYGQRGTGIKGSKPSISTGGSGGFTGTGSNSNSKACQGGACKYTEVVVLGTFGGLSGIMTCLTMICYCYKRHMRRIVNRNTTLHEANKKASVKYTPCDISVFKSGSWSARYLQFGEWCEPSCVSLSFDHISSKINGSGSDEVGAFTISGSYSKEEGRMVLIKRYELGTGDPTGNLGHRVLIRLAWNPEICQFEGHWYVRTKVYCGMDQFELKFNDDTKIWVSSTPQ